MNNWIKTSVLSAAAASMLMVSLPAAEARDHWHRHHHRGGGDAVAAGVIGLATGAIIGGMVANSGPRYVEERRYYEAPPRYYRPAPRPVYRTYEPWTREWYRYCGNRYRSFNPSTGTFVGYDGIERFCEAN
ncbi:BA14K family protein [Limoniibacter endophyticus]|uniref:Lectin-like protein BA14k n=1 Tax=Limoniibacter endophyticus TaxID=1565040 RepID=A0A8J3DGT0_9HYPH|nr:BA14K family protein [Limoniibacter endophyticus]GHC65795.1 hypothetical protein GCM10010136_08790 [Limoniibacter endophyticus]